MKKSNKVAEVLNCGLMDCVNNVGGTCTLVECTGYKCEQSIPIEGKC